MQTGINIEGPQKDTIKVVGEYILSILSTGADSAVKIKALEVLNSLPSVHNVHIEGCTITLAPETTELKLNKE